MNILRKLVKTNNLRKNNSGNHKGKSIIALAFVLLLLSATFTALAQATTYAFFKQWGTPIGNGNGYLHNPYGIALSPYNGYLYVVDTNNYRIQVFDTSGNYLNKWGQQDTGTHGDYDFGNPYGIGINPNNGTVYVFDYYPNHRVMVYDASGNFLFKFGEFGSTNGSFNNPTGIAVNATGYVFIANTYNNRVDIFQANGTFVKWFGGSGTNPGKFTHPAGVAINSTGYVYVTDDANSRVEIFSPSGVYLKTFGSFGSGNGQFVYNYGIAIDSSGNVYVTDTNNERVQVFDQNGNFITTFGSYGAGNNGGNGKFYFTAQSTPWGGAIAVDSSQNIYVADPGNSLVQVFKLGANLTVYVGPHGQSNIGNSTVVLGSVENFVFTPDPGYYVADVVVNGTIDEGAVTNLGLTITGPTTVNVTFAIKTVDLTVNVSPNGQSNIASGAVPSGSVENFVFTPDPGYNVADVVVNGTIDEGAVTNLGLTITGPTTVSVTFSINPQDTSYLAVRGGDNVIYYRTYNFSTKSWNNLNGLPSGSTMDSPAAVRASDQLYFVVRGTDGSSLWFSSVNLTDNSFSGWTILSGSSPSSPTLTSNGTALTLIVRATDNSIYYRVYNLQTQTWNDWQGFSVELTCDKITAVMQGNQLIVVVRGFSSTNVNDNYTLWQSTMNLDTNTFSGWTWIPGSFTSSPTLALWQNGTGYSLVVRGSDNNIYINQFNGAWQGWSGPSAGSTGMSPAATVVGNTLYFVVEGLDGNTLWQNSLNLNTNIYAGWTWINGTTPSEPVLTS